MTFSSDSPFDADVDAMILIVGFYEGDNRMLPYTRYMMLPLTLL